MEKTHYSPGGALCGTGALHLPEIQTLWKRGNDSPPRHLERHERVETVACLLRLEWAMVADVAHPLQRERAPSSAAAVHEGLLCPDAYYP